MWRSGASVSSQPRVFSPQSGDPEARRRDHCCLEQDVKQRRQGIGDVHVETDAIMADLLPLE